MLNTIKGQIALSFCFVFLLLISQKISADTPFIDTFYDHNAVKLLIDPQTGKIFAANESAENFYGYPALTSMFIQQINQLSPEQVASERLLAEQEGRSFFVFRHKLFDGSVKTVEVHSSPIVYQGKTLLFSIIKDISKQRDMQDELWHYQQHLESLVEEKTKKVKGSLNIIIILMGTALFISLITIVLMKRLIALKKSSNNQLSESKRLYDLAVEGTGVGIWSWNIKTDETYWSEQFFRLLGFKDNEIKPSLEEFQNRLHPDDMERATARLNAHLSHYEKYDLEFRLLCANNQYRWFRVMGRAQRDEDKNPIEMAGSIQDIHDKKLRSIELVDTTNRLKEEVSLRTQAEKLSETQRDRLQVILEQASDGIHILNMDGDVVYCSRSFYSKLGYTSGEALKLNVRDWEGVIPEEELRSAIAKLVKEPTIFETVHVKKNGDTYPAEVTTEVVSINNQTFLYASARDITKRKLAENETRQAKEAAEQASIAKSEFLANMSHEIRTPMNGVLGTLELLELRDLDEKSKRLINIATHSSKVLLSLINDILDYSKIEAGKLTLENKAFSVKQLIKSVFNGSVAAAHENKVALRFSISNDFIDTWEGDPTRILQIITNLVSNAIKFTHYGSVTVILDSPLIGSERWLKITVKDEGIGMSEETIENIFKEFSQADSSTTRKFGGTGLGLAITKNLVIMMDGDIRVHSVLEQGSTFIVRLPLKPSKEENIHHVRKVVKIPDLSGINVLIVEDNSINQDIIRSMLEETSASIEMANDGKMAIEKFEAHSPDIILMDIQMPVMDGIEACKAIRQLDVDIPIIALTANVMAADVELYLSSGFNAHIGKPISMESLYTTLSNFVSETSDAEV